MAQWHYPASGEEFGKLVEVKGSNVNLPVYGRGEYVLGTTQNSFFEQFNWTGGRNWRKNSFGFAEIFPTANGFFAGFDEFKQKHA